MIVIVSGVDKTGKSTLVEGLRKHFPDWRYFKGSYVPDADRVALEFLGSVKRDDNVICDRFHWPDEPVYSRVMGRSLSGGLDLWTRIIPAILSVHNTVWFYTFASPETIKKRMSTCGETFIKPEHVVPLLYQYQVWLNAATEYKIKWEAFNTDVMSAEAVLAAALHGVRRAREGRWK